MKFWRYTSQVLGWLLGSMVGASFAHCSNIIFKTSIDAEPWWRLVSKNLGRTHKFGDIHAVYGAWEVHRKGYLEELESNGSYSQLSVPWWKTMKAGGCFIASLRGIVKTKAPPWQHMKRLLSPIARGQKKWRTRPRLNHKGMKALRRLTPQS